MINFSISWLNGISTFLLILTAWIFTFYCIIYFAKTKIKTYFGGAILFTAIGLGWTGISCSFLFTEFIGKNPEWIEPVTRFFSYSTIPFGCFGIIYIVWELVGSKKSKKLIYLFYLAIFIIYYLLLYYNINTNVGFYPENPIGTDVVIDDWIDLETHFFYFVWLLVIITSIITLIGFSKMRSKTTGELKERSTLLLLATPLIAFGILADTVILGTIPLIPVPYHVNILYLVRFIMIVGIFLIIIAFRPAKLYHILLVIPILLVIFVVFYFFIGIT